MFIFLLLALLVVLLVVLNLAAHLFQKLKNFSNVVPISLVLSIFKLACELSVMVDDCRLDLLYFVIQNLCVVVIRRADIRTQRLFVLQVFNQFFGEVLHFVLSVFVVSLCRFLVQVCYKSLLNFSDGSLEVNSQVVHFLFYIFEFV